MISKWDIVEDVNADGRVGEVSWSLSRKEFKVDYSTWGQAA
jgi:hypothetical protein